MGHFLFPLLFHSLSQCPTFNHRWCKHLKLVCRASKPPVSREVTCAADHQIFQFFVTALRAAERHFSTAADESEEGRKEAAAASSSYAAAATSHALLTVRITIRPPRPSGRRAVL